MRRCTALLAVILLLGCLPVSAQTLHTSAVSAILMEASSGQVLYEQNARQPLPIASITKLLTALTALRSGHGLEETVVIQPEDTRTEGSSLYLKPGETVSLKTLLYGLMLQSGNDAALAIARFCGGSVEQFVDRMNETAARLGMTGSHFANPNGLTQEEHYSTAYDMALLARACLEQKELAEIMATRTATMEGRSFANHNKLLWRYPGCVGLKTGYTQQAGRTLVSAARREGVTLIAVTLNDPDDWKDHTALLDYGFSTVQVCTPVQAGQTVTHLPVEGSLVSLLPVTAQRDASVVRKTGQTVETQLCLDAESVQAPVQAGQRVGRLLVRLDGQTVDEVPLICDAAPDHRAPHQSWIQRLGALLRGNETQ